MAGPYYVDSNTSSLWVASATLVPLGARRVCTVAYATVAARGFVYEATVAGDSGATEPVWPTVAGTTVADGTVTWTCREATDITNASAFLYYIHNHKLAAGERVWLRTTHSETTAAGVILNAIGTAAAPVEWLCAGTWANNPTTLGTGALVATTAGNSITANGFGYADGVNFSSGSSTGVSYLIFSGTTVPCYWVVANATLTLGGTGAGSLMVFGNSANTANDDLGVLLVGVKTSFNNVAQGISARSRVVWRDSASVIQGATIPTALFKPSAAVPSDVELSGLDLTALTTALIDVSGATPARYSVRNCAIGAATLTTGTIPGPGGAIVTASNVASAAINYQSYYQDYLGTLIHETAIVKTGGQSDGTTALSTKAVSSAGTKFYNPLYSDWMPVWIDTVGVAKTITVDILHDSLTAMTDAETWVEVKYLSSATTPIESSVSDAAASLVAIGIAQDGSTVAWTTTGLTNPNKQKLVSPSFITQMKGYALARVALAKPSYPIYIDGNPQVA